MNHNKGGLFSQLNPMQKKAAQTLNGPLLLLAGAGSGKTKVLTHRMAYLIETGVDPFHILAITFTNKAAREMRERVEGISPKGNQIWVSTFHSFCTRILRREIHKLDYDNNFTIYDADDSERVIRACIKELNLNDKQFPAKSALSVISDQKNEMVSPEEFERISAGDFRMAKFAQIYKAYAQKLKVSNALDFDDIIYSTVMLFTLHPDVLGRYQQRFQYVMVDEYQDTNTSQYRLVRLLVAAHENLCVVGDDDQSIYAWRGANVRNILDFEKDFPKAVTIKLEQNYRSTQMILNAANHVISHNTNRKVKNLWTENSEGIKITYFKAPTDVEEGAYIADTIARQVRDGAGYSRYALLYRNNAQSRVLEDQMVKSNIPYRLFGGVRFYERMEVKDILAYLRAVHNPFDDISYTRVINVPRRGIGTTTVDRILAYAAAHDFSFSEALKELEYIESLGTRVKRIQDFITLMDGFRNFAETHTVSESLHMILADTGYLLELEKEGTEEAKSRIENVQELVSKAAEFEKQAENPSIGAFLEEVALVADIDNYEEGQETVSLMTLHSAKGLEFQTVFIPGFEEGLFPGYRSIMSGDKESIEEERRLCYVGITRAKEALYLLTAVSRMHYGQTVYNAPSRFLEEIPEALIENQREAPREKKVKTAVQPDKTTEGGRYRPKPPKPGPRIWESIPAPKDVQLDFAVGDHVSQMKYGIGIVREIRPAGADYEVSVEFGDSSVRRFMAHLSKLKKVEQN